MDNNTNNGKILGLSKNTFLVILLLILLIILGIFSFHYYGYVVGSPSTGLAAGTGIGVALFPGSSQNYGSYLNNAIPMSNPVPTSNASIGPQVAARV